MRSRTGPASSGGSFDARRVLETVERERCTALYGVPTMFVAELRIRSYRFDLRSLRTGIMAGALCPETLMHKVIAACTCRRMTIVYGLTETSPCVTQTPRDASIERERRRRLHHPRNRNPHRGSVDAGGLAAGERRALGARLHGDEGLLQHARADCAAIMADGWLRSGDQASMDDEGYVRITGRIKDLIIRGGENIAPKEIEDVLRQHPAVSDVSVYGIASEFFGEEVAAAIRCAPGSDDRAAGSGGLLPRAARALQGAALRQAGGRVSHDGVGQDPEIQAARGARSRAAEGGGGFGGGLTAGAGASGSGLSITSSVFTWNWRNLL